VAASLQVSKTAHWLIDLGPEGGINGGDEIAAAWRRRMW